MFQQFSFKAKLLALCAFMVSVSVLVGGIGFFGLTNTTDQYDFILEKTVPKTELTYEMFLNYRRIRITLRTLGLPGISAADAETAISEALDAIKAYEETDKKYVALGFVPGQEEVYNKLKASWTDFKSVGGRVIELYKSGKAEDHAKMLDIFFHDCPEKAKIYSASVKELLSFHQKILDTKVAAAESATRQTTTASLLAILLGALAGMGVGYTFATATSNRLSRIIDRLANDSQSTASASQQIAAASEELSQATTEQAASLEETAASVEEMNSMVTKTSENAKSTSATSSASEKKAAEGQQVIGKMLTSMDEINQSNAAIMTQINQSNQQMGEIVNVIHGIGEKTKVINDIVFQTKLLSFNASVEAARAGEHGKGFAVVAEEVGNLAQMSGNAAKEITGMLDSSIQKVSTIVSETKEKVERLAASGKEKVDTGSGIARQCAEMFEEIVKNVSGVSQMATEIAQAAQEQARGIQEITKAMSQLDQVTQQNSATSQQAATAAEQVSAQAASLKMAVEELTTTFRGAGATSAPGAATVSSAPARSAKVISFTPRPAPAPEPQPLMKAAAGDGTVPSQNHPGFEEV